MRHTGLVGILGSIVNVVVAGAVGGGAAFACGGTTDSSNGAPDGGEETPRDGSVGPDGGANFPDVDTFACESPLPALLSNLNPATPVDYVELRGVRFDVPTDDAGPPTSTSMTKASHGTACATATDRDACVAALSVAMLHSPEEGWRGDGDYLGPSLWPDRQRDFLVYTRGNEVGVLKSRAEVTSFLGAVDTLEEARLLVQMGNLVFACTTTPARSGWRRNPNGSWEFIVAGFGCGTPAIPYLVREMVSTDGVVTRAGQIKLTNTVCGRRPDGLVAMTATDERCEAVAEYFAQAAYLEAASVIAFRRLELELRRFGAPESLVQRARRSRADEIRHARETSALARKLGAKVPPAVVDEMAVRDVFACALENEIEGCVRETYGALQAAFQARMAEPELRPMLQRIAIDEARHAELAHDVARFLRRKLSGVERTKLDRARAETLAELRRELSHEPSVELVRSTGIPTAEQALALLDGLEDHVLAA